MPVKNRFAELQKEIAEWRHDIHQHPEILFETHRTSALVRDKLKEFGCDEVIEGIGKTGVVGVINGQTNQSNKVIGLRADMDALPINEETGLDYSSKIPGAMHACGHDGHTSMLLGAAKYLCETRNFDGQAVVIFQPAEEGGGGGLEMCKDGMMENFKIDEVYGMHNWPGVELGKFAIRSGPFFAASDFIEATISGKGGHAAKPQETIDPTVIASQIVVALQTIASRRSDPVEQVVVSITSFETSSTAFNVIPQEVKIKGTVRTLDPDVRDLAEKEFLRITELTAEALGGSADAKFTRGYPVMSNTSEQTEFAAKVARDVTGECAEAPLVMGGEDFAYYTQKTNGCFVVIGVGNPEKGCIYSVHHPKFKVDEDALPLGTALHVSFALESLLN